MSRIRPYQYMYPWKRPQSTNIFTSHSSKRTFTEETLKNWADRGAQLTWPRPFLTMIWLHDMSYKHMTLNYLYPKFYYSIVSIKSKWYLFISQKHQQTEATRWGLSPSLDILLFRIPCIDGEYTFLPNPCKWVFFSDTP